jgi:CheY-like chemotaxis protein
MGDVLAVDDNSGDLDLLNEALREAGVRAELRYAACGGDAIAILERSHATPQLVVVDLRLPRISGAEVVRFMRGHPRLRDVPVILLRHRLRARARGVSRHPAGPLPHQAGRFRRVPAPGERDAGPARAGRGRPLRPHPAPVGMASSAASTSTSSQ